LVEATWTYPDGSSQPVEGLTGSDGSVSFLIERARRGNYYLSINDVSLEGFEYDLINSTTIAVVTKQKGRR
jgi:hypothetical protein